jgi:hypothetical protein
MLLTAALLTASGCSLPGTTAAPAEPFGDFGIGEFGGIDGRQNILHVRADGVALLISRAPAAGQLNDPDLSRLRTLLTSEQFRKEVSEAQRNLPTPQQVCSDQITNEVTMGRLSISRTEPCGAESEPTPAFDEILSIVAPAMSGNFDRPVDITEPRRFPMRLERLQVRDQPAYTIKIDGAGRAMITISGRESELHSLSVQQRDTIRLLIARITEMPVTPCTSKAYYRLRVDKEPAVSGPDCGFPERRPEFRALTGLLETAFGV